MRKILGAAMVAIALTAAGWYFTVNQIENPDGVDLGPMVGLLAVLAWLNVVSLWGGERQKESCPNCVREKMELRRKLLWQEMELERRGEVIKTAHQDYVRACRESMDIAKRANAAAESAISSAHLWREKADKATALFNIWRLPAPTTAKSDRDIVGRCGECDAPEFAGGLRTHTFSCSRKYQE